jgi:hypothetical protein
MFLAARKKRQGQNRLPGLILYDHQQRQIILVATLFSQLPDCVFGIGKRGHYVRQVRPLRIILDPTPSVYREEISWHRSEKIGGLVLGPVVWGSQVIPA